MAYESLILGDSPTYFFRFEEVEDVVPENLGSETPADVSWTGSFDQTVLGLFSDSLSAVTLSSDDAQLDIEGPFAEKWDNNSVEVWIELDSLPSSGERTIVLQGTEYAGLQLTVDASGTIHAYSTRNDDQTNSVELTSTTTVSTGTAYHLVITRALDGSAELYVDATLEDSGTPGTTSDGAVGKTIFMGNGGSGTPASVFGTTLNGAAQGTYDELAHYPTVLTGTQVQEHYDESTQGETTPPTLSNASGSGDGNGDGYTGSVDTDEANGELFHVVTQSSTQPTADQVLFGQNHNGSAADAKGRQDVTSTGTQAVGQSGVLTEDTQYWIHYMQADAEGNKSSVVTSGSFTTAGGVLSNPSATAVNQTDVDASIDTADGSGTLHAILTTVDSEPTETQIKNGENANGNPAVDAASQSIGSTGTKNFSFTGANAGDGLAVYFWQEGTNSIVKRSGGVATDPPSSLASKTTTVCYPYVEWEIWIEDGDLTPSNPLDVVIDSTFSPNAGSPVFGDITVPWYYDGSKFGGDVSVFKVRFAGREVDDYSISTTSTDASTVDGLGGSVTINDQTVPDPLKFLTHDGVRYAVENPDGTKSARYFKPQRGQGELSGAEYNVFAQGILGWDGNEADYASFADTQLSQRGADCWWDEIAGQFVQADTTSANDWDDEDPDFRTFRILDRILDELQAVERDHAFWIWGDGQDNLVPDNFTGGFNGVEHDRIKRQWAARFGPRVEVSWVQLGYDLQEWVDGSEIEQWANDINSLIDYPQLYSGRAFASESSASPINPGNDDRGWVVEELPMTEYSSKSGQDGMNTPDIFGNADPSLYQNLRDQASVQASAEPVMCGERYLYTRDVEILWDEQATRRFLWRSQMALEVAAITGKYWSGEDLTQAYKDQLKTHGDFWAARNSLSLTVDNALAPDADSWAVKEPDDSRIVVYAEGSGSIDVDLSGVSGDYNVTTVDTTSAYSENDRGTVSGGGTRTIDPDGSGTSSDWAVLLEPADTTPPSLSNPAASKQGSDGYSGSVDTDDNTGTLYHVVTQSATAPSPTQVKNGENAQGNAAAASGSQAIGTTGTKTVGQTGVLSASTTYYIHYMHEDSSGNDSSVASSSSFTTDPTSQPLSNASATATGSSTVDASVDTDTGTGTIYAVCQQASLSDPTAQQVKNGENGAGNPAAATDSVNVTSTGTKNVSFAGLAAGTDYQVFFTQET